MDDGPQELPCGGRSPGVLCCAGTTVPVPPGIPQIGRNMPNIDRIRISLEGFNGGPGVATFYSLDGPSLLTALHDLWVAVAPSMPDDVSIVFPATGDRIDAAKGTLMGGWTGPQLDPIQGSNTNAYAAPAGALLQWGTQEVRDGSRVKGRTFLVPLSAGGYDTQGKLLLATLSNLQTAAQNMALNGQPYFCIWHRPFAGKPATLTAPARPAHDGAAILVTNGTASSKVAILRSRRD